MEYLVPAVAVRQRLEEVLEIQEVGRGAYVQVYAAEIGGNELCVYAIVDVGEAGEEGDQWVLGGAADDGLCGALQGEVEEGIEEAVIAYVDDLGEVGDYEGVDEVAQFSWQAHKEQY